jgi:HAD superfamily hydrolase (TIGR01509 family)
MNISKYKALITDMDGVMIDSQPIHARIESDILLSYGHKVSPEEISRLFTGKGTKLMFTHYLGDEEAEKALVTKNEMLHQLTPEQIIEIPGAAQFLRMIADKTAVAVASGSSPQFIELVLRSLRLTESVKAYASGEEVLVGKPDPAVFLLAAKRLNVPVDVCWTIEDSPFGIQAAKSVGMMVIGLTTSYSKEVLAKAGADKVCGSFGEIQAMITF